MLEPKIYFSEVNQEKNELQNITCIGVIFLYQGETTLEDFKNSS